MFRASGCKLLLGRTAACLQFQIRFLNKNIPTKPVILPKAVPVKIDDNTIRHLERLSLVDFANEEGIRRLESAIAFAGPIKDVETSGVEPMYSVLDGEILRLRDDVITDGNIRAEVLSNAVLTEEDYFVAPPGNIPISIEKNKYRDSDSQAVHKES